jgi:hypothetical protein
MDDRKKQIIELFNKNVKGKAIDISNMNRRHAGAEGHWLEERMELQHNSRNSPDIFGYEMKKESKKITFGDFSASEYIYSKRKPIINETNKWIDENIQMTRNEFIKYFGNANMKKHGRYSWSGKCVPCYGKYNDCGQKMIIDDCNNICIYYRYDKDIRKHKKEYDFLENGKILIVIWLESKMQKHIDNKFNAKGFFICKKNKDGLFDKICFGKAFDFSYFVKNIKNGNIIFDSGMYFGNNRNYSQFRSSCSKFWNLLIVEEF